MCIRDRFKDVLVSDCFVDKSLMIKDFLNMESRIVSVTAPRGFSKTMNLKMLKAFLQPENGLITANQSESCNLIIKHNLNIFKWDKNFFHLYCGLYPVISINFNQNTGNSYDGVLDSFREVIRVSFLEHVYLLNSARLDDDDKFRILLYTCLLYTSRCV